VELKERKVELKRQAKDHMIMITDLTAMNEVKRVWSRRGRRRS
jgi:hypothetical protein